MDSTHLTFEFAKAAFDQKQYREAIDLLDRVLADEPDNTSVLELRARAHFHRAGLPKAEADIRRLLELEPTSAYASELLARVLERQSRHDEAAAVRRRLAALTGDEKHLVSRKY